MSGMRVSEFMLQLVHKLQQSREITESSANQYLQTLHSLHGKTPFSNLAWLKDTTAIDTALSSFAPSTQKGYITAIVSTLSLFKDKPTYKKTYQHYYDKMMEARKASTEHDGVKSEKQKENWIDWEEVQKVKKELKDSLGITSQKHITPLQYANLQKFVVLSLYTDIPPRRNQDYMDMFVVKDYKDDMPKDRNYLDLLRSRFIFNKYKTAKTYGECIIDIPNTAEKPLMDAIYTLLKYHPLNKPKTKEFKFLVAHDGSPINSVNGITRMLNKVFGKKIGSSMLRHIYLTGKFGETNKESEKIAEAMGHSVGEQKDYILHDA